MENEHVIMIVHNITKEGQFKDKTDAIKEERHKIMSKALMWLPYTFQNWDPSNHFKNMYLVIVIPETKKLCKANCNKN